MDIIDLWTLWQSIHPTLQVWVVALIVFGLSWPPFVVWWLVEAFCAVYINPRPRLPARPSLPVARIH